MDTQSDKVRLANLYLYHVLAFAYDIKVINGKGCDEDPNEFLMRHFEEECEIKESECVAFREEITDQATQYRMDVLFKRMGHVFDFMAAFEHDTIKEWFSEYPHALKGIHETVSYANGHGR